jgi:hypothetical protein
MDLVSSSATTAGTQLGRCVGEVAPFLERF